VGSRSARAARFTYDSRGNLETATHAAAGDTTERRTYVLGLTQIAQRVWTGPAGSATGAWEQHTFLHDGWGNTRALTDTTGAVLESYAYDAFGQRLGATAGPARTHYLYRSEQWDSDLGLSYNRARYLDLDAGRFWTMDTYEGRPSDPLSLHKYLYAHADPVNGKDPSGNWTLSELAVTSGIVGTLSAIGTYAITGSFKKSAIVGISVAVGLFTAGAPFVVTATGVTYGQVMALVARGLFAAARGQALHFAAASYTGASFQAAFGLYASAGQLLTWFVLNHGAMLARVSPSAFHAVNSLRTAIDYYRGGGPFFAP
jgi:RHS repeat-associated protein